MTLHEKLQDDVKDAMRAGDADRRSVIRYVLADIHNQEIAKQEPLDDEAVIDLLGRQAQQRRDSIEAFTQGNRQDLVDKEEGELAIILQYLPEQMSREEIAGLAQSAVEETGASGPQDMGKVMGNLMPKVKGKAQGKEVSAVVSELLKSMAGAG